MKATHKSKPVTGEEQYEVTAWQFRRKTDIPVWVARKFHDIGHSYRLDAIALGGEIVTAKETDWIIAIVQDGNIIGVVLTDEEFQKAFSPL